MFTYVFESYRYPPHHDQKKQSHNSSVTRLGEIPNQLQKRVHRTDLQQYIYIGHQPVQNSNNKMSEARLQELGIFATFETQGDFERYAF